MLDPEEEQLQSSVNFRQVVYSNSKDEFVLAMLEPEMEPTLDLDKVGTALSHVQETLTNLTITADVQPAAAVGDQFYPGLQAVGSLTALSKFDRIKKLQIPLAFLVGLAEDRTKRLQDVISRNVEFLTITDDLGLQNCDYLEEWLLWEWKNYTILELLESFMREGTTPYLKRITLLLEWIDSDTNQWSTRAKEQLQGLSVQTGIPLEIVETTEIPLDFVEIEQY
ncbi:hypothetical protein PENSUB_7422 [Penicillium subrubescens]|uniref:Uncharacterized protein n=1 Tax=Penicillium subrubescens TaxID=1316194 RepID=A0A1Q5TMJ0_9EURO|nr:hypothetical protein PENSUB_7422 [Penicillium subrubescens]